MEVKINDFTIEVKDFVVNKEDEKEVLYITDSEINETDFQEFFEFYRQHSAPGEYFTTVFNGHSFFGRFGQFIYAKHDDVYKMRLAFVRSAMDETDDNPVTFVMHGAGYTNLRKKAAKQGIILNNLLTVLQDKGILNAEEVQSIVTVEESDMWSKVIEINGEVNDLDEYLKEYKDTLSDFRTRGY